MGKVESSLKHDFINKLSVYSILILFAIFFTHSQDYFLTIFAVAFQAIFAVFSSGILTHFMTRPVWR